MTPPSPTTAETPLVEALRLGRRHGSRWTLKGVDLQVHRGQLLMVAGSNGSGKTTLLRLISQAWLPSAGKLRLFGEPAHPEAAARMALLSHADYLYDELSAWENLQLLVRLGPPRSGDPRAILAEVGLEKRADEPVKNFSAGMRKRLALARLLWKRPEIVLLDEPYGQLDPSGALLIDSLFRRFRQEGTTVLVATHQVQRVAPFCDAAIVMAEGRLDWSGPAREAHTRLLPGAEE